jgi:signal transduction histidine kinase
VADRKLLHTAFTNILSNAVKYSPHGGVIEVRVVAAGGSSSGSAGGAVDGVAGVASAGAVCVRVEDHGIGIPEADQPRLFQPFHRAGNVGSLAGTGLGLSIAKEMIELMHGAIGFQSKVGEGTCFEFTLPPALAPCSPAEAV